jgi:hypothetical protein
MSNEVLVWNRTEWKFDLGYCSVHEEKYVAIELVLSHNMMHIALAIRVAER